MKCVKEELKVKRVGNGTFLFMHQDLGEICLLLFQISSLRPHCRDLPPFLQSWFLMWGDEI